MRGACAGGAETTTSAVARGGGAACSPGGAGAGATGGGAGAGMTGGGTGEEVAGTARGAGATGGGAGTGMTGGGTGTEIAATGCGAGGSGGIGLKGGAVVAVSNNIAGGGAGRGRKSAAGSGVIHWIAGTGSESSAAGGAMPASPPTATSASAPSRFSISHVCRKAASSTSAPDRELGAPDVRNRAVRPCAPPDALSATPSGASDSDRVASTWLGRPIPSICKPLSLRLVLVLIIAPLLCGLFRCYRLCNLRQLGNPCIL
jgi:hypothetical protein